MPSKSGSMNSTVPTTCDIFCKVIDNFGDIGVCWRLARQLAKEHSLMVRLWVDDLESFAMLCPEADVAAEQQKCKGVEVRHWQKEFPVVQPADLVIEAFACKLPQNYLEAMAARVQPPFWINLEYLSAEEWVESHHKLPSPHPKLPLTKYFFFPGFTRLTGGLLLERDLLARRDEFQRDFEKQSAFWRSIGVEMPLAGLLKISLFAYENEALEGLFDAWSSGTQPVYCLAPEGRIMLQVGRYFGAVEPHTGSAYTRGNLHVHITPFVEQERYDELLWACDVNFVRGEDSLVRAIWAGRPFVWQIYPQHDEVHLKKLQAFMARYCEELPTGAAKELRGLWEAWNGVHGDLPAVWNDFLAHQSMLRQHSVHLARQLAVNNLALNLLDFCGEIGKMRALKIEG
jgi:uncharacterized repeat protein (TIGR03837 family)